MFCGRAPGPGYVLAGSALSPAATSLPVSAAFLPWLADVVASRLNAEPGTVRAATPGQRVAKPAGVDAIESASGTRTTIPGSSFDAPLTTGVFFFVRGSRRVGALVVNHEVDESRLDRWPVADLGARVADGDVRVVSDRDDWVRGTFAGVSRRSLVVPLLMALLLVLAAESIVATARVRA